MPRTSSSPQRKRLPVIDRSKHRAQIERTFLHLEHLVVEGWDLDCAVDRDSMSISIRVAAPKPTQSENAAGASSARSGAGRAARARNHARVRANNRGAA
jgi:hypothetical protein